MICNGPTCRIPVTIIALSALGAAYWFKRQAQNPSKKLPEPWPEVSAFYSRILSIAPSSRWGRSTYCTRITGCGSCTPVHAVGIRAADCCCDLQRICCRYLHLNYCAQSGTLQLNISPLAETIAAAGLVACAAATCWAATLLQADSRQLVVCTTGRCNLNC